MRIFIIKMSVITKRNMWTDSEVQYMLDIMRDKKVLSLLDGKKYKNKSIYIMIEKEMKNSGFNNKTAEQIILKWRKVKAEYIKATNKNKISGAERTTCPFYDELSDILRIRPSATFQGIDSSDKSSEVQSNVAEAQAFEAGDIVSCELLENEEECSINSQYEKNTEKAKQPKKNSTSYEKSIAHCTREFISAQTKLQEEFLLKQKELIDYEHELQKKHEKELLKEMTNETRKLLEESSERFCAHMRNHVEGNIIIYDGNGQ